jgi:hypothetical protein
MKSQGKKLVMRRTREKEGEDGTTGKVKEKEQEM